MNLRIIKTRRSLSKALDSLLNEKLYEDITVTEICARAQVRRVTFYDHFSDKEALLVYVIREMISEYSNRIFERFPYTIDNTSDFYKYIIKQSLEVFEEKRKYIGKAMHSETFSLLNYLWQVEVYKDLKNRMIEDEKRGIKFTMPVELSAHLFCGVISGLFNWMLETKEPINYDLIMEKANLFFLES